MDADQLKVQMLLIDTVTLLCKNGLTFDKRMKIEGVIGITVDESVFIVHINEELANATSLSCEEGVNVESLSDSQTLLTAINPNLQKSRTNNTAMARAKTKPKKHWDGNRAGTEWQEVTEAEFSSTCLPINVKPEVASEFYGGSDDVMTIESDNSTECKPVVSSVPESGDSNCLNMKDIKQQIKSETGFKSTPGKTMANRKQHYPGPARKRPRNSSTYTGSGDIASTETAGNGEWSGVNSSQFSEDWEVIAGGFNNSGVSLIGLNLIFFLSLSFEIYLTLSMHA